MAKKTKQQKKQKGVKGKKARAKAKLERQWGEVVSEEQLQLSKIRKGKSRTSKYHPSDKAQQNNDEGIPRQHQEISDAADEEEVSNIEQNTDEETDRIGGQEPHATATLKSLLTKINYSVDAFIREHEKKDEGADVTQMDYDNECNVNPLGSNSSPKITLRSGESDKSPFVDLSRSPYACHFTKAAFDGEESAAKFMDDLRNNTQEIDVSNFVKSFEMSASGPSIVRMLKNDSITSSSATKEATLTSLPTTLLKDEVLSLSSQQMTNETANIFTFVHPILSQNWDEFNKVSFLNESENSEVHDDPMSRSKGRFTNLQKLLYPALANYSDMLITVETSLNRTSLHNLLVLHVLNHSLTSRLNVLEHNKLLRKKEASESEVTKKANVGTETDDNIIDKDDDYFRDQGYTRPKVLILLPTRGTCYKFVRQFFQLLGELSDVSNADRFEKEFGAPQDGNNEERMDGRARSIIASKGPEWNDLFGPNVNEDDDFKLGVSISPKHSKSKKKEKSLDGLYFNLYSEFYQSDIILASPLGLKMVISNKEEDFLSSIEVCTVLYSDVLLMQNWDHLESVLNAINLQPRKIHETTDFSRVRNYCLVGQAAHFRQLVFTSSFGDPAILSTFKRFGKSLEGRIRIRRRFSSLDAAIANVSVSVKQVFHRVPCASLFTQSEARIKYFEQKILPQLIRLNQNRTLIFIPSYFDFVSLRNLMVQKEVNFCKVTEYCKHNDISRNRSKFLQHKKKIMLYTGRAHFFMRLNIKGVRHLIFLGLPEHHMFYSDLMNKISMDEKGIEENEMDVEAPPSCLALFTKYDTFALERIVGSKRCEHMLKNEKETFLFAS
jgi:U3 small nucleolar RNA-associated protein 25